MLEGCAIPGCLVARATEFCTVAPTIYAFSVRRLPYIALLVPRTLRWLQDIWKISGPLMYYISLTLI
jgi:hypothetical protein